MVSVSRQPVERDAAPDAAPRRLADFDPAALLKRRT